MTSRRKFLKLLGIGMAAVAALPVLPKVFSGAAKPAGLMLFGNDIEMSWAFFNQSEDAKALISELMERTGVALLDGINERGYVPVGKMKWTYIKPSLSPDDPYSDSTFLVVKQYARPA